MSDEWRPVPGYEGSYLVSPSGIVRSIPRRRTAGGALAVRASKGYPAVQLWSAGVGRVHRVHRVVAAAFLGPCPDGQEVRHLDGDCSNPAAANLAYGTRGENQLDKRRHGTDRNARKTHCAQGHEFTAANTRVIPSRPSARYCRACEALRGKGPRNCDRT